MKIHLNHEEPPEQDNWPFGFDPKVDSVNSFTGTVSGILLVFSVVVILISLVIYAFGRDDGRYANSPLSPWFKSQKDKFGTSCCADADGVTIKDLDWSAQGEGQQCRHTPILAYDKETSSYDGHYCIRYKNEWWLVPDSAVLPGPNLFGQAILWPICTSTAHVSGANACKDEESSLYFIRCFIPGAGT